jgi:hypothetical protein
MDAEALASYGAKYLYAIVGRMLAESAVDTSDAEIERTLKPCVCGDMLVPVAKHLRDSGALSPAIEAMKRAELTHQAHLRRTRLGLDDYSDELGTGQTITAEHDETGRLWRGPRGAMPRRYTEIPYFDLPPCDCTGGRCVRGPRSNQPPFGKRCKCDGEVIKSR